jgi:HK97 family phage prohead protease
MEFTRSFALEDISVRTEGKGRIVDAYATVFDTPSYVKDQDGEYYEEIAPTAFNRAIEHARRAKGGFNIPVMFNHGMTLFHTPSEIDSMPIGVAQEIRPEKRGLFTRSLYHNTERADDVLEAIKDGSITAQSFSGAFKRSSPNVPRGGFRSDSKGEIPTVRREESTLREYGPAVFAVHAGAEFIGVRAEQAALILSQLAPGEIDRLANMISSSTRSDPLEDGTPDMGPATEDSLLDEMIEEHSVRSPKEQLMANYAAFIIRTRS